MPAPLIRTLMPLTAEPPWVTWIVTVVLRPTNSCFGVTLLTATQGFGGVGVPTTWTVAVAVLLTTPVFGQSPPVAPVVGEVMCTVNVDAACVVPAGTVTGPQVSTPNAIAQVLFQPAPCPPETIDQDRPAFVGSVSDSVTPCASPLPVLETVSVNPIGLPTFTRAGASAVFTIWMSAALITNASSVQALEAPLLLPSPE